MRRIVPLLVTFLLTNIIALRAADRQALIIGNAAYQYQGKLDNPVNDATDLAATLRSLGFEVKAYTNLSQREMRRVIDEFGERLRSTDVGLFFFAGHGMQANGENYLFPVDANPKAENEVEYDCVNAGRVLSKMQTAGCGFNIVILDACRNNPFAESWSRGGRGRGLAFISAPTGSIVAYATSPGKIASDGSGRNGLYTSALLRYVKQPGLKIEDVFKRVRNDVQSRSGGKQVPWELSSLTGDFYFKQGSTPYTLPQPATIAPKGMVLVEGGTFQMGDIFNEGNDDEKPVHTVSVSSFYLGKYEVTFDEYDAFCATTGRQKPEDSSWERGARPVINVSWLDAVDYCNWRSRQEGLTPCYRKSGEDVSWDRSATGYRLPTEAEWEYAAREGGRKVRFGNGKDVADPKEINFNGQADYTKSFSITGIYREKTMPVGTFSPNRLELYDMSGNAWEWCWDWYKEGYYATGLVSNPSGPSSGKFRALRGGGCLDYPEGVCVFSRYGFIYGYSDVSIDGFRLARTSLTFYFFNLLSFVSFYG